MQKHTLCASASCNHEAEGQFGCGSFPHSGASTPGAAPVRAAALPPIAVERREKGLLGNFLYEAKTDAHCGQSDREIGALRSKDSES